MSPTYVFIANPSTPTYHTLSLPPGLPVLSENLLRGFTPIHEERLDIPADRQVLQHRSDTDYEGNSPQVTSSSFSHFLTSSSIPPPLELGKLLL